MKFIIGRISMKLWLKNGRLGRGTCARIKNIIVWDFGSYAIGFKVKVQQNYFVLGAESRWSLWKGKWVGHKGGRYLICRTGDILRIGRWHSQGGSGKRQGKKDVEYYKDFLSSGKLKYFWGTINTEDMTTEWSFGEIDLCVSRTLL